MKPSKILVIGFDCAAPEILLRDTQLPNLARLMANGCYGTLESVTPAITVPAWMCMATSRDPGSLGVYGFRNRKDYSYGALGLVDSSSLTAPTLWDQVELQGGARNVVGVPPNYPPAAPVRGVSVGCFLTPDTVRNTFTHPAELGGRLNRMLEEYPVDVSGFRTSDKRGLLKRIYSVSRRQFAAARFLLRNTDWNFFQFVEIGLDRLQHGFWSFHDPRHVSHVPDNPFQDVIRDYYRHLDEELGRLLDLLDEETIVLVLSDHGARPLDGGFCINEWLVREGLLALDSYPREVTPFSRLSVDWSRTRAWSEGGYYARVFLNVRGREPQGTIAPEDVERFRDELKSRLEGICDPTGAPLGTQAFKPEELYRETRNVAPDLIVYLGSLAWRSIGGVGYPTLHVRENDTGPDDCNHAQHGAFVLSGSGCELKGEIDNAQLLDMAPLLLDLAGYDRPRGMQGKGLVEKQLAAGVRRQTRSGRATSAASSPR